MQAPAGEVMSLSTPQIVTLSEGRTGYHGNLQINTPLTHSGTTQIEEAHSTTNLLCGPQSEENDDDKRNIYKHPLFPLMALLLEKCEQATQTPDCPSSDSFDVDIQAFVHRQEQERRPFFSEDLELDGLMVKAIQVLRIHLLELEKVSELCKDFCNRYITCLKGKLQSENLLRTDMQGFDPDTSMMDDCLSPGAIIGTNNNNNLQGLQNSNVNLVIQGNVAQTPSSVPVGGLGQGQVISGGTVYQMVQTPQGLVAQPIQIQSPSQLSHGSSTPVIQGTTPLSQIGVPNTPDTPTQHSPMMPSLPKDFFDDDDYSKRKNKRGILPKQATQVMKSWLFQHIMHPYPTEDEKRHIASQTNLTMLQVNNWFINARRRILQPMLDASNPEGPKAKKSKPQQNRPVQRFWPENLANLGSNPMSGDRDSPTPSESPTSSTNINMDGSYDEDDDEDGDDGVTIPGLVPNQFIQATHDVSSTSSAAATLNLIADVAMAHNTNFLPVVGGSRGVMSSLSSAVSDSLCVLGQNPKPTVLTSTSEALTE